VLTTSLIAFAERSVDWSPAVGVTMIVCNIIAIAIAKYKIDQPKVGAAMPSPAMFGGLSLGAVIGTTCFGHILGAGTILGLSSAGIL
jgi:photosystem I subunit X